jgi:hypothetical protein
MEVGGGELIPCVTERCLTEDLGLPAESVDWTMDELATANEVIAAFRKRRADIGSPGQEPIRSLLPEVIAFSLHVGRRRGATWHHREAGVVWLLAVGYHREGHVEDAYAHFERLKAAGRLLPDRDDMRASVRSHGPVRSTDDGCFQDDFVSLGVDGRDEDHVIGIRTVTGPAAGRNVVVVRTPGFGHHHDRACAGAIHRRCHLSCALLAHGSLDWLEELDLEVAAGEAKEEQLVDPRWRSGIAGGRVGHVRPAD